MAAEIEIWNHWCVLFFNETSLGRTHLHAIPFCELKCSQNQRKLKPEVQIKKEREILHDFWTAETGWKQVICTVYTKSRCARNQTTNTFPSYSESATSSDRVCTHSASEIFLCVMHGLKITLSLRKTDGRQTNSKISITRIGCLQ